MPKILYHTTGKILIHNIDTHDFWGRGPDLQGTNMMEVLLWELCCSRFKLNRLWHQQTILLCLLCQIIQSPPPHAKDSHKSRKRDSHKSPKGECTKPISVNKWTQRWFSFTCAWGPSLLVFGNSNARSRANLLPSVNVRSFFWNLVQSLCMSRRIGKSWDFMKRTSRIEFSQKVLKIQEKLLYRKKLDKMYYWWHLFWHQLLLLVIEISSCNECTKKFNDITLAFLVVFCHFSIV